MTLNDDVLIAVDPHKASNTAAVLDPVTKTVIETARFANTEGGLVQAIRLLAAETGALAGAGDEA